MSDRGSGGAKHHKNGLRSALSLLLCAAAFTLTGCASLAYYGHVAKGQYDVLSRRQPIAELIQNEQQDATLRQRLSLVLQARRFASTTLHLPDNGSYTQYADLGRSHVVWNVFATPEFSLEPLEQCFWIAGCLAYRGYFDEALAQAQAEALRAQGHDVDVAGIPAYSTLGWFDDPVLNTMLRWDDAQLIATVFHELAHQQVFFRDDTALNESFASFVEQEGLRQYALAMPLPSSTMHKLHSEREKRFVALMLDTRAELKALYTQPLNIGTMRTQKQAVFMQMQARYQQLRNVDWGGWPAYDPFFARAFNNARLLPFGLYDEWVPAFAALFARHQQQWPAFYAAAAELAAQPAAERRAALDALRSATLPE